MEKENPPPYTATAPPPVWMPPARQDYGGPAQPSAPTVITIQNQPPSSPPQQIVVVGGGCPSCHVGALYLSHCTFCGVLWAILLFPIGLLCLLCCTTKRCTNCTYTA